MKRKCPFCGIELQGKRGPTAKTAEHIIPKWLIEFLGLEREPITGTRWDTPTKKMVTQTRHATPSFVSGGICAKCNNGWMSELENEARDSLKSLIADPRGLSSLSAREANVVARWTLKTAAALNLASFGDSDNPLDHPIPAEHLRTLVSGDLPAQIAIVGAGHPSRTICDFVQNATWAKPDTSIPLRADDQKRSYKVGMSFRNLLLGVAYYPDSEYYYGLTKRLFRVLWSGDKRIFLDKEGVGEVPIVSTSAAVESFIGSIFLVSKTWLALTESMHATKLIVPPPKRVL
jgi:hypothetical protein